LRTSDHGDEEQSKSADDLTHGEKGGCSSHFPLILMWARRMVLRSAVARLSIHIELIVED
jgi:hypothetical protein